MTIVDLEAYRGPAGWQPPPSSRSRDVFFERRELNAIFNLYAQMVAAGEWRDYAISHDREACCFAIFRRSCDAPLFRIIKMPKLAKKQGAYCLIGMGERILKRGKSLAQALAPLERQRLQVVDS